MRKLSEGLWSDIVRRGTTGETRMEDSIDLLTGKEFYEHLEGCYEFIEGEIRKISHNDKVRFISFPIYKMGGNKIEEMVIEYDEAGEFAECIKLDKDLCYEIFNFYDDSANMLIDYFDECGRVAKDRCIGGDEIMVFRFKESINKKHTIIKKFIDTLSKDARKHALAKVKNNIEEGLWSDIVRRGTTGETRMEDDVNNMNMMEFLDYIKKKYEGEIMDIGGSKTNHIITIYLKHTYCDFYNITYNDSMETPSAFWYEVHEPKTECDKRLLSEFDIKSNNIGDVVLRPKDGSPLDHKTCVSILDIINDCNQ